MRTITTALLALLAGAAGARAQQTASPFAELPDSVAERLVAFYNSPGTIRLTGVVSIAPGTEIGGPVAVLGGPITVAGRIDGELAVINGSLRLEPGAVVVGHVTVVGGSIQGAEFANLAGGFSQYGEPLRYRQQAGELVYDRPAEAVLAAGRDFGFGRTDFLLAVRGAYNRVEGLPISVGPRLRLGGSNPTLLEGLVIYRSSSGLRLDPDELGYSIRAEQYVGGRRFARIGLRTYSEIVPVEQWGLSDRENSLATFLLHRDYRDAYERTGWAGSVIFERPGSPHSFAVEYRDERHARVLPSSPWSLFDNDEEWRPQPLIAEGTLRSVAPRYVYDTRNDQADPTTGWHVFAQLEQGLGGHLRQHVAIDLVDQDTLPRDAQSRERFTSALLDVRRYLRLGPETRVSLRLVGAGSVDGTTLPPQRQQTLGGEGSLPAYSLYSLDCGARSLGVEVDGETFFPFYGCDRLALIQVELDDRFPYATRLGQAVGMDLSHLVRWVVFFDAGRAWTEPDARRGRLGGTTGLRTDAGAGLRIGRVGVYWAVPLSRAGGGVNFFVRIGRRI